MAFISYPQGARATEAYAMETGRACGDCHVNSLGGGELTAVGKAFAETKRPAGGVLHGLRFIVGYIHLLTGVFWFGTILYVHIVLKPSYASRGLPKGEVGVGLVSMAVMAVTGILLTRFRFMHPSLILQSRFGVLLLVKIALFLVMAGTALFVVFVIGPKLKVRAAGVPLKKGRITLRELTAFDGCDGRAAWIAFRGRVYDMTKSRFWPEGVHFARHGSGIDLTRELDQAPHGADRILAMPEVGELDEQSLPPPKSPQEKTFYFMAYMNLALVFLILLIVAAWRWL